MSENETPTERTFSSQMSSRSTPNWPYQTWLQIFFINTILIVANQLTEQTLNSQLAAAMSSESMELLLIGSGLIFNTLFFTLIQLGLSITVIAVSPLSPQPFNLKNSWNDFTKEWIRSLGVISLWFFAFALPGIIRWVEFMFLPFVVFFDDQYKKGKIDALDRCREVAKPVRFKLWILVISFGFMAPLFFSYLWPEGLILGDKPWEGLLNVAANALVQTLSFWVLSALYFKTIKRASVPITA